MDAGERDCRLHMEGLLDVLKEYCTALSQDIEDALQVRIPVMLLMHRL